MTKIDIISGFLGAGKTTFIKKMIDEVFHGQKIVLIENEFGEVGIDGGFLKDSGIQISEMNSGCICCSLVGDFGKNLNEVITKYHPDRILIEPSGVGKLSDVMKSVIDIEKEQDVKLNALVTVVNSLKASKQMKAFGEFFNNQIEFATTVILSRTQNATPEQLEFCVKQIQNLNPKAAVITTGSEVYKGRIQDTFTPVIQAKLAEFGCEMVYHAICDDDDKMVTEKINEALTQGVDIVLCTGGMSVDPDDKTPLAIKNTGANIISYGSPILPGAMFLLSYKGEVPIVGLPGCVMYAKRTVFDLVLCRLLAKDVVTYEELCDLGEGGLCLGCDICTYPNCGFGK